MPETSSLVDRRRFSRRWHCSVEISSTEHVATDFKNLEIMSLRAVESCSRIHRTWRCDSSLQGIIISLTFCRFPGIN